MVGGVVVASRMGEEVGGRCDTHNRACRFTGICPGEATLTLIPRGTIVNPPSSRRRHVRLVHEGILGVFRLWPTGEETLASLWLPGHVFGIMSSFGGRGPRPRPGLMEYDVRALVPATVCLLHPDAFVSHVCQEPSRAALILQILARQAVDQLRTGARPTRKGPEKTLAHILAVLAESGGIMAPNGTLIPHFLPHQALADMSGITRSTATRAVHCLCRRRLIRVEGKQILIPSVVKLWEMIEEECP